MSFKDGIPLLASFDDDVDDDDLSFQNIQPPSKYKCSRRTILFSAVLGLAITLVIGLIVGITVPVVLLQSSSGSSNNGNNVVKSSESVAPSMSVNVSNSVSPSLSMTVVTGSLTATQKQTLSTSIVRPSTSSPSIHGSRSSLPVLSSMPAPTSSSLRSMPRVSSVSPSTSIQLASTSIASSVRVLTTSRMVERTTTYVGPGVSPTPSMTPPPPIGENCSTDGVICHSKLDERQYMETTLNNTLRVLLISDPNSNISAAAMDIPAGSFNDPPDYEGLAHFCEHMLFIGTKKYSKLDQYSNYLRTHGGGDNAYTSTQNTNYFFSVEADYFSTALDMFAHFFIDPLFSEGSVMDEMNAVDAEHQKNLQTDGWKQWQLLKNVSNPAHPFSQFSTGSLETLNKTDTRQQLLVYFNNSYSANTMQLVVYGRDNLETLLNLTKTSFSAVPNRNLTKTTYNTTSFPAESQQYSGFIVHYYPVADQDTLTLYWQITPSLEPFYRNAVSNFIAQYLGHEGTTSAAYQLKNSNYITSLGAYVEVETDSYSLFAIEVVLTDGGVSNVSEVVRVLFQHIYRLKNISENKFDQLWEDFAAVSRIKFDYSERATPINYVSDIASNMRTVREPVDFLLNPRRFQPSYDRTISTLSQFTPEDSIIFLGTHNITFNANITEILNFNSTDVPPTTNTSGTVQFPWPKLDQIEPIYQTPFHRERIPQTLIDHWNLANDTNLSLPPKNVFIPDDFTIIDKSPNSLNVPVKVDGTNDSVSMWSLLDTEDFRGPRVNIMCMLNQTNTSISPSWEAPSRLFASFIQAVLQPRLYDATLIGSDYSITPYTHGLMFSLSGLSGIMQTFIPNILSVFNKTYLSEQGALFNTSKTQLVTQLRNYNYTKLPFRYTAGYIQQVVMVRPYWTNEEILAELEQLNMTQVINFGIDELLTGSGTRLLCLSHGNVDQNQAQNYAGYFYSRLRNGLQKPPHFSSENFGHYWQRRVNLTEAGNYSVVLPTLNPEDLNTVVNVVFQVGEMCHFEGGNCSSDSLLRSLHLALLTQMLGDECFTFLRTRNKLGYVAYCTGRNIDNIGSFQVLVQSEAYDGEYVYDKITKFLEDYVMNEVFAPEDNFTQFLEEQKAVYKSVLLRKDANLGARTQRFWSLIQHGQPTFDLRRQLIDLLDSSAINTTSVKDFYLKQIVDSTTFHKMIIVVNGKDRNFQPSVEYPLDYTNLTDSLTYPVGL